MDQELTNILNNLKTISKLDDHQKLSFMGNDICIQNDSLIATPLNRWWNGQSQEVTVRELESLLSRIDKYVEKLLNSPDRVNINNTDTSRYDQEQLEIISSNLTRIVQLIKESSSRFSKLIETYQNRPTTVAKLETIKEEFTISYKNIMKKLEKIESHRQFNLNTNPHTQKIISELIDDLSESQITDKVQSPAKSNQFLSRETPIPPLPPLAPIPSPPFNPIVTLGESGSGSENETKNSGQLRLPPIDLANTRFGRTRLSK